MKKTISTILLAISLLLFAAILDYLLLLLMDSAIFRLLNLFNSFSLLGKLLTIFLGGTVIISMLFYIVGLLSAAAKSYIFDKFHVTAFITVFTYILFLVNAGLGIKVVWDSFPHFGFWTFLEFLMLTGCILGVNFMFISWTRID